MKKALVMIGGGIQQVPAIQRIKDLGYTAIVTDKNKNAQCFPTVDVAVNIDADNIDGLISWVIENKKKYNISGIFTTINRAAAVAQVGNATGLPSVPANIAITCDNKLLMKKKLVALGIPTAEFHEIKTIEEAEYIYKNKGKRTFYLKAVDGFGGRGVKKITSLRSLNDSFSEIKKMSSFPSLIIEECLIGDFIDAQGVFCDGKFYPAGIADSYFSNNEKGFKDFNPVETFNICPSQHNRKTIKDVYHLLERAARRMGINWGPVGGDFILTESGLKIIEITPRLHGPNGTLQIFPAATGIKPFEFMVQCIAGDTPNPEFLKPKYDKVALCKVFVSNKKHLNKIGFITSPKNLKGLFNWFIYWKKGDKTIESKSCLTGLATVYVLGDNFKKAMADLKNIENSFIID